MKNKPVCSAKKYYTDHARFYLYPTQVWWSPFSDNFVHAYIVNAQAWEIFPEKEFIRGTLKTVPQLMLHAMPCSATNHITDEV